MIRIREISSKKDIQTFVDLPYRLYRKAPYWIPPIKTMEASTFDPEKNPVLDHCLLKLWIAERDNRAVGRIGCFINDLETQMRGEKQARFNWLEFEDDPAISTSLLDAAEAWATQQGAHLLKGPLGFTNLDSAGMTIDGFEEIGTTGAPFHFPYYKHHMEEAGFRKVSDYLEVVLDEAPTEASDKIQRLKPILEKKFGIRLAHIRKRSEMRKFATEMFNLIVQTYKDLPSFVPLSDRQVQQYAGQYIPFLNSDYLPLVKDREENVIGFGILIPSFSKAMVKSKGKLFPFGLLRILWARKFHDAVDLMLIGVVEEWRNKGINALIFASSIESVRKNAVKKVYINPILEENQASLALFKEYGPRVYRRRRVFGKDL